MNKQAIEQAPKLMLDDYSSIKDICKKYPAIKESTLRWYVATRNPDFIRCIVKWGGRVMVHKQKFVEWANNRLRML